MVPLGTNVLKSSKISDAVLRHLKKRRRSPSDFALNFLRRPFRLENFDIFTNSSTFIQHVSNKEVCQALLLKTHLSYKKFINFRKKNFSPRI